MSLPKWNTAPGLQNSKSHEWRVPLSELNWSEDEVQRITAVLRSGWWTSGPEVDALERAFESRMGVRHAIAVANGTAALHLAFVALGIAAGDEVITPSLTFVAAANTILHTGAVPRFADVHSLEIPLVSAETIEKAITPKTRCICPMHYGGYACDMDAIADVARRHGLWIVEDAAHSPGATWNGKQCGCWGDIGCFSFFGNKNLTCAEGGLLVTDNEDLAKKLRLLRSHGMDSLTWHRFQGHSFSYDVSLPGFNYRMDDLRAALLHVQLQSLDHWNRLRRERVRWYREILGADENWAVPFANYGGDPACHLMTVVLGENVSRMEVMRFMRDQGIQTSIHYPPIHQFSFYRGLARDGHALENTEALGRRILTVPLFPSMTYEQVSAVCEVLRDAVKGGK